MEAIILAGGLGTRMLKINNKIPKTILDINGKPFLVWIIKYLEMNNIKKIILCLGVQSQLVKNTIENFNFKKIKIQYITEDKPLGTGGALINAIDNINDKNFIFMNGDTIFDIKIEELFKEHIKNNNALTYSLIKLQKQNTDYGGISIQKNGVITEHKIGRSNSKNRIIDAGLRVLSKKFIKEYKINKNIDRRISFENDIAPWLIKNKKVKGIIYDKDFFDIGNPVSYTCTVKYFDRIKNKIET
tara:strand:- start:657 stop:1388 length:732 start_codon:yes stop_codon:yes gene_type:complete